MIQCETPKPDASAMASIFIWTLEPYSFELRRDVWEILQFFFSKSRNLIPDFERICSILFNVGGRNIQVLRLCQTKECVCLTLRGHNGIKSSVETLLGTVLVSVIRPTCPKGSVKDISIGEFNLTENAPVA